MQEGQIVRNKKTGQVGRVVNGQVVPIDAMPDDPMVRPQAQSAQAGAAVDQATINAQIRKANAEAEKAEADARQAQADAGGALQLTPAQRKVDEEFAAMYQEMQASGGIADIRKQVGQLRDAVEILRENDNITGPVIGRMPDFIKQAVEPDSINVREQIEEVVQRNLRLVLGAQFTQQEGERLISRAFNPNLQEGDNIDRVERLIEQMESALDSRESAIKYYEDNGTIAGWSPQAAGAGATQARGELPEGFQNTINNLERGLYQGTLTPEQYAAGRMELDRKEFGDQAVDQSGVYMEEAYQRQQLFNQGVTPEQLPPVSPPNRELSGLDQFRNDVAVSPFGTAVANYADAGSAGLLSTLTPEQMRMAADVNPNAALLGTIGGGITGAGLVGKAGREITQRAGGTIANSLLRQGGKSQLARNVGTDIAYGTAYGVNTGQDVGDAALASTVGSVGGNLLGNAVGRVVRGAKVGDAAQYLRDRNIPLTTGQTLGGMARGIEDKATSIPIVGDMINSRRLEGLQAFNREAINEAGRPIGATTQRIGREGLSDLQGAQSRAYDASTEGFRSPLDTQYGQDIASVQQVVNRLPPDAIPAMDKIGENYITPIIDAGEMSGDVFQNTQRALKMKRGKPPQAAQGFEQEWRDAITAVSDANRGLVTRAGGNDVVRGLDNADRSYRLGRVVEDATDRAKGGSASGEVDTFTPSQLQMASQASQRKFPGANPLRELADQGQRVLPSRVPDSGTTGRAATAGLGVLGLSALTGVGANDQGMTYSMENPALAAGSLAALMLGGSRGGQRAINALLTERPDLIRKAFDELAQNRLYRAGGGIGGIFGSGAVPLALNSQGQ